MLGPETLKTPLTRILDQEVLPTNPHTKNLDYRAIKSVELGDGVSKLSDACFEVVDLILEAAKEGTGGFVAVAKTKMLGKYRSRCERLFETHFKEKLRKEGSKSEHDTILMPHSFEYYLANGIPSTDLFGGELPKEELETSSPILQRILSGDKTALDEVLGEMLNAGLIQGAHATKSAPGSEYYQLTQKAIQELGITLTEN